MSKNSYLSAIFLTISLSALISSTAKAQDVQLTPFKGGVMIGANDSCPEGFTRFVTPNNQHKADGAQLYSQNVCLLHNPNETRETVPENETAVQTLSYPLPFLSLSKFGTTAKQDPVRNEISFSEYEILQNWVKTINFPPYLYSGCHDRAHAAYMLLPDSLKSQAVKVWTVAPAAYTRGVIGTITLKSDASVSWGYHVALAFETSDGLVIFDPALAPNTIISERDWYDLAIYPELAFRTYTEASVYLFTDEEDEVTDHTNSDQFVLNKDIWTGNNFQYGGAPRDGDYIPNALARDAVGERLQNGKGCEAYEKYISNSGRLLNALSSQENQDTCEFENKFYQNQIVYWKAKLGL